MMSVLTAGRGCGTQTNGKAIKIKRDIKKGRNGHVFPQNPMRSFPPAVKAAIGGHRGTVKVEPHPSLRSLRELIIRKQCECIQERGLSMPSLSCNL